MFKAAIILKFKYETLYYSTIFICITIIFRHNKAIRSEENLIEFLCYPNELHIEHRNTI